MSKKHTPGPWKVGSDLTIIGGSTLVAKTYGYVREDGMREANANLIAAAPALLDACRLALTGLANKDELDIEQSVFDAIAMAEGRKP